MLDIAVAVDESPVDIENLETIVNLADSTDFSAEEVLDIAVAIDESPLDLDTLETIVTLADETDFSAE